MRIAIVHDYLNQAGGAERVVAVLHQMFPAAPIYTTILDRATLWPALRDADIRTSWLQNAPGVLRHFRAYLPCYPFAIESLDLSAYDVVISSSSAFAKAAVTRPDALHVCYCHTPMRFAWDFERYVDREEIGWPARIVLRPAVAWLKRWDWRTSRRPDLFIANSTVVAARIRRHYGRSATIVFPPIDSARYRPGGDDDPAYLVVSRLAPYKRIDIVVRAFTQLNRPLVVIGDGRDRTALEALAGPTIQFLGAQPDDVVAEYYARCRALVCGGQEDFGIAPLEANASGRPVVAFAGGGALDTVIDGRTGILIPEQSEEAVREGVRRCDAAVWDGALLRRHAEQFDVRVFQQRMQDVLAEALAGRRGRCNRDRESADALGKGHAV